MTDEEWDLLEPLLPLAAHLRHPAHRLRHRGGQRLDHRGGHLLRARPPARRQRPPRPGHRPSVVKRCFNRLKQFRDLAIRYAKRAAYYQADSPSPPLSSGSD
ncbi:hypothetical protein C1I99_21285 [Micromonospora deserti]|uniref:Transposase n=1 Tax=Micromonospora deserti TaxID=2070366 RepID=A0A2W2DJ36_9ACTN|nr:hypothetical protein C1I99_21285 [Micromonospora deserti]